MPGLKVTNEYSNALGPVYGACPKAVLAAIAVSFATVGGDYLEEAQARILREWQILYQNGIVPQCPPARFDSMMVDQPAHDREY